MSFKRSIFQGVLFLCVLSFGGKAFPPSANAGEGDDVGRKEISVVGLSASSQAHFSEYYSTIDPQAYLPKTWKEALGWSATLNKLSALRVEEKGPRKDFLRAYNWVKRENKDHLLPCLSLSFGEKDFNHWGERLLYYPQEKAQNLKNSLESKKGATLNRESLSDLIGRLFPAQEGYSPIQEIFSKETSQENKDSSYPKTSRRLSLVLPFFIKYCPTLCRQLGEFNEAYDNVLERKKTTESYNKSIDQILKEGAVIQASLWGGSLLGGFTSFGVSLVGLNYFLCPLLIPNYYNPQPGDVYLKALIFCLIEPAFLLASGSLGLAGATLGSYAGFRLAARQPKTDPTS